MCCRYYMEMSAELRPIIEAANRSKLGVKMVNKLGKPLKTGGEIRPTDMVPVIAPNRAGIRTVFPMVWGYPSPASTSSSAPIVNCRIESAAQKPMWKDGWASHRCIIPASWYFEWEHFKGPDGKTRTGAKYFIQPKDSRITWLAGIYKIHESHGLKYPVFAVLTREPSEELLQIHDRMPLILPGDVIDDWIKPESRPEEISKMALMNMVFEKA